MRIQFVSSIEAPTSDCHNLIVLDQSASESVIFAQREVWAYVDNPANCGIRVLKHSPQRVVSDFSDHFFSAANGM